MICQRDTLDIWYEAFQTAAERTGQGAMLKHSILASATVGLIESNTVIKLVKQSI